MQLESCLFLNRGVKFLKYIPTPYRTQRAYMLVVWTDANTAVVTNKSHGILLSVPNGWRLSLQRDLATICSAVVIFCPAVLRELSCFRGVP